jgi:NMD protein affecting ribosome stability and mRNA decay
MAKCTKCGDKNNPLEAKFCSKCGTALSKGKASTKAKVETTFGNKCSILADLWLNHRSDEDYEEFIEYNDIGLPLAYVLDNEIAVANEWSKKFVDETFDLLLESLGIEDQGFIDLQELIDPAD